MAPVHLKTAEILEILKAEPVPGTHPFDGTFIDECELQGVHPPYPVDFQGATFNCVASFKNAEFSRGASFLNATFRNSADFSFCVFDGPAFFWRSRFFFEANFFRITVKPTFVAESKQHPGEANFSYSQFIGKAIFKRARFGGLTYFHRTLFKQEVNFEESRFDEAVVFEGLESDICVSAGELPNEACRELLVKNAILIENADHVGFFNFDPRIRTTEGLEKALGRELPTRFDLLTFHVEVSKRNGLFGRGSRLLTPSSVQKQYSDGEINDIKALHESLRLPTFATTCDASFARAKFMKGCTFCRVNLSRTFLQGAELEFARFLNVDWSSRPLTLGAGTRRALHDETKMMSRDNRLTLAQTYHEIRVSCQKRGETDQARDFYYGELEMIYLAKAIPRRWISLTALYRYSSGYGRQEGLAGLWLILFIAIIFPALFFVVDQSPIVLSGLMHKLFVSELRSLEACTFMSKAVGGNFTPRESFIEGLERITVALQAGMCVLATKWKFERNPGGS